MSDNGPQQLRYTAGLRDMKGSVYDGGTRAPFFLKYPAFFKGSKNIDIMSAHIDVLPTLSELCHVGLPKGRKIDGKSLVPLIVGKNVDWSNPRISINPDGGYFHEYDFIARYGYQTAAPTNNLPYSEFMIYPNV